MKKNKNMAEERLIEKNGKVQMGDGNIHELQASEGEHGRERKLLIWRNTRGEKQIKTTAGHLVCA